MAINDKRLIVSDFDFDDVKSNLKLFLEAQKNLLIMILRLWFECPSGHFSIQYSLSWF